MRARYGENIGVELFFQFPDLQPELQTFLTSDSAANASSLSANGGGFSVGQYIVVGNPGNEFSELLQIHAVTAPTSTTITLASNAVFAHNRGDIIRVIPENQIVPEFSSNSGASFTAASAINIRSDATETYLQRATDLSTYQYRFRFYNSTTGNYSAYSAIVTATGYADNTAGSVKRRALSALGEDYSDLITDQDLNDWLAEGRRLADQNPAVFRWSFRTKFEQNVGYLLAGQYQITAPSDLRDRNTYKNILGMRIGQQNRPCVYQDRVRFNQNYLNVAHTTLANSIVTNATSITLTNSRDFDSSGTLTLASGVLGTGVIAITYTANNKSTGVLTGVTGVTANVAAGVDAWQRYVPGLPTAYTIDNGTISFDSPLLATYDGQNVHMDYYSAISPLTDDSSTFDEPFYDLYVYWLKWKIKSKKANGKLDRNSDPDYQDFISGLGELVSQETPGQRINFIPDIEGFLSATE